ncbi:hypothetical protein [Sulfurimonas sp. HSL-1716]|uniref:hypothetical protein n=1 Tax=Hydrocurvibacter sulfurireducens TaxID=3131937 RepID=UPI0031FA36DC
MSKMKKWVSLWFITISSLLVIGVFNYVIDPYQQYRKATFYKVPYENEKELDAGLAKNFDYDSVVIGTSMMQNFNIDDLKNISGYKKPIKLTIAGSSVYEQNIVLSTAFRHQNVKNVLIGIDFLSYYGAVHRYKHGASSFPTYLYDENILNDYKYLISSDTLGRVFEIFTKKEKDGWVYDYSKMFEWRSRTQDKNVLSAVKRKWLDRKNFDNEATDEEKKLPYMKNNFDHNIKPLIEKHPNVNFTLLFPPYSILAYKTYEERGQLQNLIKFKRYIVSTLLTYQNVKIYDFQNADEISHDLHNYYDLYHYNKDISRIILKEIRKKDYIVDDVSTYAKISQKFLSNVANFNVTDDLFKEK